MRPSGRARSFLWGGYHKLCAVRAEDGSVTRLTYDLDGFPVELVTPAGQAWKYEHDTNGRLAAEVGFDGGRTFYGRDLSGRIVTITDALGRRAEFVRDAVGCVVERHYPDDLTETVEYDALGELASAKAGATEIRIDRDAAGRITRQRLIVDGETYDVLRGRDGDRAVFATSHGHVVTAGLGSDAQTWRYVLGGTHEVTTKLDPGGRELERRLPGGAVIHSAYDAVGRLAERSVVASVAGRVARPGEPEWLGERVSGVSVQKAFRYDADGHISAAWDRTLGSAEYEVNPVGRLLAVARDGKLAEAYAYDVAGNPTRVLGVPASYAAGDRLTTLGRAGYTYDALGQLVEKRVRDPATGVERVWTYTWDGAGRLASVSASDGVKVGLVYDALGRRVQKRVSRVAPGEGATLVSVTTFLWDGSAIAQEIKRTASASGDPVVEERSYWIDGEGFGALAHRDVRHDEKGTTEGEWVHYVSDPNGTPERLVDGAGQVLCELERTAFGRTRARPGARAGTQLRFMGQYEDAETGLHYNHFRHYDPDIGRYISPDPIGMNGGINLYRYVSDPNTMVDPLGLAGCQCVLLTKNGPSSRQVETSDGSDLYAWRKNSGSSVVDGDTLKSIPAHEDLSPEDQKKVKEDQRGKCAEPKAMSDYKAWLAKDKSATGSMEDRVKAGVVGVVPMEGEGANKGAYKAPCPFCAGMLANQGLSDKTMRPDQAVAATNVDPNVVTRQPLPPTPPKD